MSSYLSSLRSAFRRKRQAHDEDEATYLSSEGRREDAYKNALHEFRQKFDQEEKAQAEGEHARKKEFDELMSKLDEILDGDHQRWEILFSAADTRQEGIFEKNEDGRQAAFLEGQSSRTVTSEREQETYRKHSEWHAAARATLFEQGRQARKDIRTTVDTALTEQFKRLLEAQEASFIIQEGQRNDSVQNVKKDSRHRYTLLPENLQTYTPTTTLTSTEPSSLMTSEISYDETPEPSKPIVIDAVPSYNATSYTSLRTGTRTPIPQPSISPRHQRSIYRSRSRSPTTVIAPPPELPCIIQAPNLNPTSLDDSKDNEEYKPSHLTIRSFEQRFAGAEAKRFQIFIEEEQQRESRFRAAEDQREAGEVTRLELYTKKGKAYADNARNLFELQRKHFNEREQARLGREAERNGVFQSAQERRSNAFDLLVSQTEEQIETERSYGQSFVDHLKLPTILLNLRQIAQLEKARTTEASRFMEAQQRRDTKLAETTMLHDPARQPSFGYSGRAASPVTGFAGSTLVHNLNVHGLLPTPDDSIAQGQRARRRQLAFERSQNRMLEIFENNAQTRHHTFTVKETRRDNAFRRAQHECKALFEAEHNQQNETYKRMQQLQEMRFQAAEGNRSREFQHNESDRDWLFKDAEGTMAARFHHRMRQLQDECFEDERKRTTELEVWGAELLRERETAEEVAYNGEDEE